jgi:hypothetical protein
VHRNVDSQWRLWQREREREREEIQLLCARIFSALISPLRPPRNFWARLFFLFHYCLSRHRQDEGKSLKKKSGKRGKKTHLAKTQKSSKIICIDPPHQHDCVKRWRSLFFLLFRLCVVALVSFYFHGGKKNTASHNNRVISETIGQRT